MDNRSGEHILPITVVAPISVVAKDGRKRAKAYYLSFNNYHTWSPILRAAIKVNYSNLVKAQLTNNPTRFKSKVRCTITYFPPDKRKHDLDNHTMLHAKYCSDALTEIGCWADDDCVCEIMLRMGSVDRLLPRVEIVYDVLTPINNKLTK